MKSHSCSVQAEKPKQAEPDNGIVLVVDLKLRRPACVLLQAAFGCGHNNGFLQMTFEPNDWLLSPTPDMQKIRGTREEWQRLAAMLANKKKKEAVCR